MKDSRIDGGAIAELELAAEKLTASALHPDARPFTVADLRGIPNPSAATRPAPNPRAPACESACVLPSKPCYGVCEARRRNRVAEAQAANGA